MTAVLKHELRNYFHSFTAYVFGAFLLAIVGFGSMLYNLQAAVSNFEYVLSFGSIVFVVIVPILTMRLMSEDKRSKTDQLLLTAPVPRIGIVLGKYLSALCVYLIAISGALLMALVLSAYAAPDWPVVIGNLLGLALLGTCLIAICMFLSSLTESQVISAVCGFAVSLFLILVDALVYVVSTPAFQTFFSYLSFNDHYNGFTYGIIDFSNVLFFVSIAVMFLLFTTAVLEKRRWS